MTPTVNRIRKAIAEGEIKLPPEYEQFLSEKLNWFEGHLQDLSATDELLYLDIFTQLRILEEIQGVTIPDEIKEPLKVKVKNEPLEVKIKRVLREPQRIITGRTITEVGTYFPDFLADCRSAGRMLLWCQSSLDVDVDVQVIGNVYEDPKGAIELGSTCSLPAGDRIGITVTRDYWHPRIGAKLIVTLAPTGGRVDVDVATQE